MSVRMADATMRDLEVHRAPLRGHCYRMLGSISEADDAVQDTMIRAWRSLDSFQGRASLRTWLYRIATRVCLDAIGDRARRASPLDLRPACTIDTPLTALPSSRWVEPIPDALALPTDVDPSELAILRESIRLAFVVALQHLPARQRAVLLLTDVLGWRAAEVAESLGTSVASVNSALQRARATLEARAAANELRAPVEQPLVLLDRYVDAFERYDIDALTELLHEDVSMSMPPYDLWLRGHDSIRAWLLGPGAACRGSRLIPTSACGSRAFGQYRRTSPDRFTPWSLIVLELAGDQIVAMTHFLDTPTLFPRFDLPAELVAEPAH